MSMHPELFFEIPELAATVAEAAFPKGTQIAFWNLPTLSGRFSTSNQSLIG